MATWRTCRTHGDEKPAVYGCAECVTELREENAALRSEADENKALRDKLSGLLSRTAVALRGPEPSLTRWSWHDLPERAAAAIAVIPIAVLAERERYAEQTKEAGDLNYVAELARTASVLALERAELRHEAMRVLVAWDGTVLPKSHDGLMQERMESLRAVLGPNVAGNRLAP